MNLASLVIESARRAPGDPAVSGPDGELSYGALDRAADRLAARLRARGAGPGDRVVIWLEKSVTAVVAFQAVLRLSAVYVPVDAANPLRRAVLIARGCGAALLVTDRDRAEALDESGLGTPPVLTVGAADLTPAEEPNGGGAGGRAGPGAVAPASAPAPDDLAYILYTSGSTGEPKGVCVTHRNALTFVRWAAAELGATRHDRFANHAPFGFDLSVLDLYAAFLAGASVRLVPAELAYAPRQLTAFLTEERITVWYSVPSVLVLMIRDGGLCDTPRPPALRALLFAGEPFPAAPLARLYGHWPGVRFLNLYGPTETNVCTFHEVTAEDIGGPLPIGRVCAGNEAWAERAGGGRAGPLEDGELVVAGPTVMAGYWGRPAQRGPYRTGDLVRVRADGGFDYRGRLDQLVKIRGHRVELGEIEAVLARHPAVDEAAVLVDGEGTAARLVAVVVPGAAAPPGLLAVKRHCAALLPRYMIPDAVVSVPELPRTRNGKTDRSLLRTALSGG
ncbi:amino acid adenylation domain-containing protein [Streptomyces sp. NPDC020875]|uniref:amino acid adenylation domain-containing protein n=1 Tax=Streptomyces sp. NPDC020875 TaxID=3154898 RepID=UPI0033D592F5